MIACTWLAATHVRVTTDLDAFMPTHGGAAELLSELRAGPAQRIILMGIKGGTEQTRAAASAALATRLRDTGLFARVANGEDLMDGAERALIFSRRYLLSPGVSESTFTTESLRKALRARLQELRSPMPVTDTQALTADPTGEFYAVLRAWAGAKRPDTHLGVWFSSDRTWALLLAETKAAGFDLDAQTEVATAIESAFRTVSRNNRGMTLQMSGPPIFAIAAQQSIRLTVARISTAASLHGADLVGCVSGLARVAACGAAARQCYPGGGRALGPTILTRPSPRRRAA